jgi:peptidoglycan/LPS O-acetylase OafA/YrhL
LPHAAEQHWSSYLVAAVASCRSDVFFNPNSLEIKRIGLFLLATAGISILSYRFIEFPQKTWRSLLMVEPDWVEAKRFAV